MSTNLISIANGRGTLYRAVGTAVSANIKASSARILSFSCTNLNASIRYFQIFNTTSAPSGGATPLMLYPVYPSSGFLVIDKSYLGDEGISLTTGLSFGFSTTPLTYTAGTAADAIVEVRYI